MANSTVDSSFLTDNGQDSIAEVIIDQVGPKRRRRVKTWKLEYTYDTEKCAYEAIASENSWKVAYTNSVIGYIKKYYKCATKKCNAELCLWIKDDEDEVSRVERYKSSEDHQHPEADPNVFSDEKKRMIDSFLELNLQRFQIMEKMRDLGLPLRNVTQLSNYIARQRTKMYGRTNISVGEFESCCIDQSVVPDGENEPYVLAYDNKLPSDGGCPLVRLLLTTKKLVKLMSKVDKLHVDATYKLNWQGLPTIVIGDNRRLLVYF